MLRPRRLHRHSEVQRVRHELERGGYPRLYMLLLVSLTGGVGFIASSLLLRCGLTIIWLRYLAAFAIAYLVFLLLLWLWLRTRTKDCLDSLDLPDLDFVPTRSTSSGIGGGGSSGGGGASGSLDSFVSGESGCDGLVGEALSTAAEAEELAIPLVMVVLAGALLCVCLFAAGLIVYSAPVLFAELMIDGVLSAGLYRRLRGPQTQHWLETAIRRTVWPFVLAAMFAAASGWAMTLYAPEAHSIGDVLLQVRQAE